MLDIIFILTTSAIHLITVVPTCLLGLHLVTLNNKPSSIYPFILSSVYVTSILIAALVLTSIIIVVIITCFLKCNFVRMLEHDVTSNHT